MSKRFQLIPVRGRKHDILTLLDVRLMDFNLSPQGDGNLLISAIVQGVHPFQLIPARGRKHEPSCMGKHHNSISTYPRKGTETYLLLWLMKNIRFQLIPARGRKHFHLSIEIMMCIISTYPRKGTETALVNHLVPEVLDFNLSPQGDGNGTQTESLMIDLIFQLIPARGRKPEMKASRTRFNRFQLIPARGRKLEYARVKNNLLVFQLIPVKTLSGAARRLSRRESFSGCHLPCTKLPLSGELARRKP